jgi:hypothetical protein
VFHKGFVVGADTGGGTYDGSYTENPETRALDLFITLSLPAGAEPVMTGIPLSVAMNLPIRASLRQEETAEQNPRPAGVLGEAAGPVGVPAVRLLGRFFYCHSLHRSVSTSFGCIAD